MKRSLILPSDEREIFLEEFSVEHAMEVNSHSKAFPEFYITKFLEAIQGKENISDPKQWTTQDRYFAMFDIFVRTFSGTPEMIVNDLTYKDCGECGGMHMIQVDYSELLKSFTMRQGPLPEISCGEETYTLRPLTGSVMEELEMLEYGIPEELPLNPKTQDEVREALEISSHIGEIRQLIEMTKISAYLGKKIEDFHSMGYQEFSKLSEQIQGRLKLLKHGINFVKEGVKCPKKKGSKGGTLPIPFHSLDIIHRI